MSDDNLLNNLDRIVRDAREYHRKLLIHQVGVLEYLQKTELVGSKQYQHYQNIIEKKQEEVKQYDSL